MDPVLQLKAGKRSTSTNPLACIDGFTRCVDAVRALTAISAALMPRGSVDEVATICLA
jgi:hypothetical protein